ncbi:MAG: hypothetical protein MJ249_03145 [Kiritimatiellae bacterium]|nr:hypothetical protein [Kiritimatiellia bacterium]
MKKRHLVVACLMVVCWAWSSAAGELRLEAESAKLLPAAGGGRAFVSKVIGPSGTPVVGSFERGAALAFGPTPAAKWLHAVFATNSSDSRFRKDFGKEPAYVEFFDGTNRLGRVDFPDTEGWFSWDELIVPVDFPACSDFRLVAPHKPINLDYLILSNGAKPSRRHEDSAPPVDELKKNLLAGEYGAFDEIVFATRTMINEHWYANFGYFCSSPEKRIHNHLGRLCAYNVKTGKLRTLLEDLGGAVRDPAVHYDGKTIVFSYRPAKDEHYHLYTINADGTGLKQLTSGIYDDIEPTWLPDGDVMFVSSRCRRWVNCWLTQVASIYRMKPDGSGVRMLSANIEHDNTPWMLPDGRVLYMRWEYVDRRQVNFHHLWTMNPDGTQHQIYQGNTYPNSVYIDAKPIPGTDEVVGIDSPGHGQAEHAGALSIITTKGGPDNRANVKHLRGENRYCDPWAFSRDLFMATDGRTVKLFNRGGRSHDWFSLPASFGDRCRLYEPRPLMPHARERLLADRTDLTRKTGEFYLENVLIGRTLAGVKPGTVKKLMVLEVLPRPISYTGGMDPISCGGTFSLERLLGWVPVEPDGSAYFEAPALRSLAFVAMDGEGRAVKRMQSFTQVMPGERQGCVGCHEKKTENAVRRAKPVSMALSRGASKIDPTGRLFDVPDFPRDIQPILDRHCVRCHNPDGRSGGVDLCGDHNPFFSMGYFYLSMWGQLLDGRNDIRSDWPPYARWSGGSPLMDKLYGNHHGVTVTSVERRMVMQWLDVGAPYPGTYAALGCGSIGGYIQNRPVIDNDEKRVPTLAAQPVIKRRCDGCHTGERRIPHSLSEDNRTFFWYKIEPRLKHYYRCITFNLTRPEKSLYLKAPLAKEAGGYGTCTNAQGQAVFASTDDPDYRKLLAMIEDAQKVHNEHKRFDMPGFRPPIPYLREMQRFGVLPWNFDLEHDPVDPYALDRRYWDLDWPQLK